MYQIRQVYSNCSPYRPQVRHEHQNRCRLQKVLQTKPHITNVIIRIIRIIRIIGLIVIIDIICIICDNMYK